jgi:hypothetical protein
VKTTSAVIGRRTPHRKKGSNSKPPKTKFSSGQLVKRVSDGSVFRVLSHDELGLKLAGKDGFFRSSDFVLYSSPT